MLVLNTRCCFHVAWQHRFRRMQHHVWETVDGQKIAPLHERFCFSAQIIACSRLEILRCWSPPASPPCSMLLSVLQLFVCCPCLSLLVASWNRSPILNPVGRGEVCVLCFFFVAVPLVYFSGAIFCPSTVKMMCFVVHAHVCQNEYATLR